MMRVLLLVVVALLGQASAFTLNAGALAPRRAHAVSLTMATDLRTGDMVKVISGDSKVSGTLSQSYFGLACGIHAQPCQYTSPVGARIAKSRGPMLVVAQGEVAKLLAIDKKNGKVTVEGINVRTKHVKPMKEGESGQLLKKEMPIAISNVALADEQPAAAE